MGPAPRPRPSKWWFALGGGLVLLAILVGGTLFLTTLRGAMETDGQFRADGAPHTITVSTREQRVIYVEAGHIVQCDVLDAHGRQLRVDQLFGSSHISANGHTWTGENAFVARTARVTVRCTEDGGSPSTVRIGPSLATGKFVGGIFLMIILPMVLGGAGVLILLVSIILFATRPARS